MEQRTDPIFKLEATVVRDDGRSGSFSLSIFYGGAEEQDILHFCWVRCSHIRDRDIKIYGVDDANALGQSVFFAECFLKYGNEHLVNTDGCKINLSEYHQLGDPPQLRQTPPV